MKWSEARIKAILITAIIHLLAGIVFMIVKIGDLHVSEFSKQYEIALQVAPAPDPVQPAEQQRAYSVEQVIKGDQEMMNIARNLAAQPDPKINKDDYIDKVKEELIESGKLGKDNYIDEQKKTRDNSGMEINDRQDEKKVKEKDKKTDDANEMASKYSGPTRIYYELQGRTHSYLPLPIYKCEGAGKVVLKIEVSPRGDVTSANILPAESSASDPCLIESAVNAALISRFNADIKAVKNQTGTLTYLFVAQ
jgi:hypothetical protein